MIHLRSIFKSHSLDPLIIFMVNSTSIHNLFLRDGSDASQIFLHRTDDAETCFSITATVFQNYYLAIETTWKYFYPRL
jgi:hypothetical protein